MRHGIVLFTSDRGITPAQAAKAAEDRGFDAFYVPEHTHIPAARTTRWPGGAGEMPRKYAHTYDLFVAMTAVPQRTALSHAFGALCVTLVGTAEFYLRTPNEIGRAHV